MKLLFIFFSFIIYLVIYNYHARFCVIINAYKSYK